MFTHYAAIFAAWAFFFLLGGVFALNLPCVLLAIATILHLIAK